MTYAFVDSETQTIIVSNQPPHSVSMFWDVEDDADPDTLIIDASGDLVVVPKKPDTFYEWDMAAAAWVDTRTPEEVADALNRQRQRASMTRTAFCVACARLGIISEEEAVGAARGDIPAPFLSVFDAMTDEERFENRVRWAGAVSVSRVDPIVLACASHIGMSAEGLDALFGVSP